MHLSFLYLLLCLLLLSDGFAFSSHLKTYIVHVKPPAERAISNEHRESWYKSFLPSQLLDSGKPRLLYSYHHVVSGFAARLTEEELAEIEQMDGFLLAHPDRLVSLHTTHTPDFLGLQRDVPGLWTDSNYGAGVIVGVLDTGVTPNHPSFSDKEMPAPPAKWNGKCEFTAPAGCNRKLIGARNFVSGSAAMDTQKFSVSAPPYDSQGHGTHTASTVAGAFVPGASSYGNANGTAVGMAPLAHLAIYKVCAPNGCASSDILAGMDTAVADGVDILSLSLGGQSVPFYADSIAVGAFGAIQKGIFVSCAGGNSGPSGGTLSNEAPWILTVGASTMDRSIRTTLTLGDGQQLDGESLNQAISFPSTSLPLVYAGGCASLSSVNVRGKVVLCDMDGAGRVSKGSVVKAAGGAGMILANQEPFGYSTLAEAHVLPASHVSFDAATKIKAYISSTFNPVAKITPKGTVNGSLPAAPMVAYFSSRGPSKASSNILKPDIIGPGVNVLAGWPTQVGPIAASATFNVISGTSMATPHLSGIVALLKAAHPDWTPAMIKSAIMTSADINSLDGSPIGDQLLNRYHFFAMGAGHVNPFKAANPGLVYEIQPDNYISYLCGLGYFDKQVSAIVRRSVTCKSYPLADLNYPSIVVSLDVTGAATTTRTVTNVGAPGSIYTVNVDTLDGVSVDVEPSVLSFSATGEKQQFTVSLIGLAGSGGSYMGGFLTWVSSDGVVVHSPIIVAPSSSGSSAVI